MTRRWGVLVVALVLVAFLCGLVFGVLGIGTLRSWLAAVRGWGQGPPVVELRLAVPAGFDGHVCFVQSAAGDPAPVSGVWSFKLTPGDDATVRVPSCQRLVAGVRFLVYDDAGDPVPFYLSGEAVPARGRFARIEDDGVCCLRLRVSAPPRRSSEVKAQQDRP